MYVAHSRQNSVAYNKRMPRGTYFAEYDWTCRNQVSYLYGSACDLKFFRIAASKKILTAMSKPIEFSVKFVLHTLVCKLATSQWTETRPYKLIK
jgi:hypothetical protein